MTGTIDGVRAFIGALIVVLIATGIAHSEERKGPVTNLPMPRFVSMKATEANVRRGPSLSHRIDWVYQRKDLPLQITNEHGHWRQVRDHDGAGGWVHYSLLSGVRTVLIQRDQVNLRIRPDGEATVAAILEKGVVARVDECRPEWCRIRKDGHRGWARTSALWGIAPNEVFE